MTTSARPVGAHELRQRLESPAPPLLLDVRTPAEFETAHLPGSHNVPLDVITSRRDDLVDRVGADVVFVCRTGARASRAEQLLRADFAAPRQVLHGGIADWEAHGFALERGRPHWDLERQVRLVAGSIVLTSIVGSVAVPKLKWVAAGIGGGLTFAAVSNTCAMADVLSRLPYNRRSGPDPDALIAMLDSRRRTAPGS